MNHKWFKNLNWEGIIKKQVKAPFIPIIKNETDVSNFDKVTYVYQVIYWHAPAFSRLQLA